MKITNVLTSPNKTKYFKATLHNGKHEKSLMSYNPSLHDVMSKAKVMDKPVKISNFKERIDDFTQNQLITLTSQSSIEYSQMSIPTSEVHNIVQRYNLFSTIADINNKLCVEELVNVTA